MTDEIDGDVEDEVAVIPFAAWLQDLRDGRVHAELTEALRTLVEAVTTHHKDGELLLKLKIKPADSGGAQVIIVDETIVKAPEAQRPMSLFFVDPAHNLTRVDPLRPQLAGLREVPAQPTADLKEAK